MFYEKKATEASAWLGWSRRIPGTRLQVRHMIEALVRRSGAKIEDKKASPRPVPVYVCLPEKTIVAVRVSRDATIASLQQTHRPRATPKTSRDGCTSTGYAWRLPNRSRLVRAAIPRTLTNIGTSHFQR